MSYRREDFEPGDVVIYSTGYVSYLGIAIVTGLTPKMVSTTEGFKFASSLCFAPKGYKQDDLQRFDVPRFQRKFPNVDINYKVFKKQ